LELASQSERFQGESVVVYGVICDGIETASISLQPGTTCRDIAGINLQLGPTQPKPRLGSRAVVVGRFMDTSLASPGLLNYRDNQYLGNFVIAVQELKLPADGPNNSFKPKPLRGSA
jgi:hypothetical protein